MNAPLRFYIILLFFLPLCTIAQSPSSDSIPKFLRFNELDSLDLPPVFFERREELDASRNDKGLVCSEMASLYYSVGNYQQAIPHYKCYATHLYKTGEYFYTGSMFNNIGLCFQKLNDKDSALFYFNEALKMVARNKTFKDEGARKKYYHFVDVIKANQAEYLIEEGLLDDALPFYISELKSARAFSRGRVLLSPLLNLSKIYYLKKEPEKSLAYQDSAFLILNQVVDAEKHKSFLLLRSKCLLAMDEFEEANLAFLAYHNYTDSLILVERQRNYIEAAVAHEAELKSKAFFGSRLEIEAQKRRTFYLQMGLVVAIILVGGFLFVFFFIRRKNRLILEQKDQVAKALSEKEVLLKEIHHRVKNNLQVISGLLQLQSSKYQHPETGLLIGNTQKHIHSVALVHEMLYQNENLDVIDMGDYLEELGRQILEIGPSDQISYHVNSTEVSMPVDYATTIGLILNELITNSLKHAFHNEEGSVWVNLELNEVGEYKFVYMDNGRGMSEEQEIQPNSLGLKLVHMFAEEIDAALTTSIDYGMTYDFRFKLKEVYA